MAYVESSGGRWISSILSSSVASGLPCHTRALESVEGWLAVLSVNLF
jgi:hypothetical protein